jgi:site-specific DNA-methyltransferase (cytosine-N4-specific)
LTTRFSRLHPYPAMVGDELACSLVRRYVPAQARILDPFCGAGKFLAAAEYAAVRVGIDANPLAWLLTKAKLAPVCHTAFTRIIADLEQARRTASIGPSHSFPDRKVEWFAPAVLFELRRIVCWINSLELQEPEKLLVASALSATVREVSFARLNGWKLHRVDETTRLAFRVCPWKRLERRLRYCLSELRTRPEVQGERHVALADARSLSCPDSLAGANGPYDVILTSPPYGDSRTTVQYGAASSLCLAIVSQLNELGHLARPGSRIDRECLGGRLRDVQMLPDTKRYWAGAATGKTARSVATYLADYDEVCGAIANNIKPEGKAILVVGRRSTGGYRLKLDLFTVDRFLARGFDLISREVRLLQRKRVPRKINKFGASHSDEDRGRGIISTMTDEIILILQKRGNLTKN